MRLIERKRAGSARIALIAGIFSIALLIGWISAQTYFPDYDAAYNISVAKNWSSGAGYATIYDGDSKLFNPEITTGPTMLLPVGIAFWLFQPDVRIAAMVVAVLNGALTAAISAIIFQQNFRSLRSQGWGPRLFGLLVFLLVLFPDISNPTVLGEFTGSLFFILGVALIPSVSHPRNYLAVGFFLGLALLTKTVFLIDLFGGLVAGLIVLANRRAGLKKASALRSTIFFAVGIAVPIAFFEIAKFAVLGFDEYFALKRAEIRFLIRKGSGVEALLGNSLETEPLSRLQLIFHFFPLASIVGLIVMALVGIRRVSRRYGPKTESLDHRTIILFSAAIAHVLWWVFLAEMSWSRHLEPVATLVLVGAVFSIPSLLQLRTGNKRSKQITTIAVLTLLVVWQSSITRDLGAHRFGQETYESAMQFANELEKIRSPESRLFGCGWLGANRRIEIVLQESGNFYDCTNSTFSATDLIVVDSDYWSLEDFEPTGPNSSRTCALEIEGLHPFQAYRCTISTLPIGP